MPPAVRAAYDRQYGAAAAQPTPREKPARPSKYGAKATVSGGIRFDSKREARTFERLVLLKQAGEVRSFHRQVIFDLPGGVIYRLDFLVFFTDGRVGYWDAKGVQTKEFRIKRRLVRAECGVEIELV
jgi:hypothetical protein